MEIENTVCRTLTTVSLEVDHKLEFEFFMESNQYHSFFIDTKGGDIR